MRVLVTGGFGFIGGHLIERLLNDGHTVHVVDDLRSCPIPYQQLLAEVAVDMLPEGRLTWSISSVANYLPSDIVPNGRFDWIFHLASPVGPAGVLKYAGKMTYEIVTDTYRLINLALRCGSRLVDVSTSEVYGGGKAGYCQEDMNKNISGDVTVRLEYATAKLAAEVAILNTCKVEPLRACIVRPFNVAGARQSLTGGFVLPRFIHQANRGEPLTVFGDGEQVRAFTHVSDIVDGLVRAMEHGGDGEVYNLGNHQNRTTILDLAAAVNAVTENSAGVVHVDPRDIFGPLYAEAADKYPDASKAMRELGWKPDKDIEFTIRNALAYEMRREADYGD